MSDAPRTIDRMAKERAQARSSRTSLRVYTDLEHAAEERRPALHGPQLTLPTDAPREAH